jgi:hypothetical protein
MTADASGNDILAVGVPLGGFIGVGPFGTTLPDPEDGADPDLVVNVAIKKLGLLKTDGGPQFAWAADGDPLEFWQPGYTIPTGLANVTLTLSAAEALADQVRAIVAGATPDANGYTEIDGGGHATQYVIFTAEIFKSGAIRRRAAANATLQSTTEDQSTRGDILGEQLVFKIDRSPVFNNNHFGEWVLPAA